MKPIEAPKPPSSSTNPKVLMALGRAFNAAGDKHSLTHFKEVGRDLIVKAREAKFSEPQLGDQRKNRATKEAPIKPAPIK